MNKTLCIDVETRSLDCLTPDIVGFGSKINDSGEIQYHKVDDLYLFKGDLESTATTKICHNLKFEFQKLLAHGIKLAPPYFDTQVAAHLINPSREIGLKKLALAEFNHKMTNFKEVIKKGVIDDVPFEELATYCKDDVRQTYALYQKYAPLIELMGHHDLFYNQEMPLIIVIANMELSGVKIDVAYLEQYKVSLQTKIDAVESEMNKYVI